MILTVNAHRPVKTLTGGSVRSQSPGAHGLTLTDSMSHIKWLQDGNSVSLSTNLHLAPFQTYKISVCTLIGMHVPQVHLWRSEDSWQESLLSYHVGSWGLRSPSLAVSPFTWTFSHLLCLHSTSHKEGHSQPLQENVPHFSMEEFPADLS